MWAGLGVGSSSQDLAGRGRQRPPLRTRPCRGQRTGWRVSRDGPAGPLKYRLQRAAPLRFVQPGELQPSRPTPTVVVCGGRLQQSARTGSRWTTWCQLQRPADPSKSQVVAHCSRGRTTPTAAATSWSSALRRLGRGVMTTRRSGPRVTRDLPLGLRPGPPRGPRIDLDFVEVGGDSVFVYPSEEPVLTWLA